MFAPERLAKLSPAHRLRKAALLLTECERRILGRTAGDGSEGEGALLRARALAQALATLPETPPGIRSLAESLWSSEAAEGLRALDALRHGLFREGGQDRADWDLLDPEGEGGGAEGRPLPGLRAYFEDIRSPFNIGSMFRSAEALGFEEVLLSPASADPAHPRAFRSAMGTVDLLPWRRAGLEALDEVGPAFALELGGEELGSFVFPERGIVVVGSEELGVSREAMARCGAGRVSIPLRGAKASLNVGVAFGILASAWATKTAQALAARNRERFRE